MFNWRKIFAPTASDLFAPHVHMQQLADSANTFVPVANRDEAAQLIADQTADREFPTPGEPVLLWLEDEQWFEVWTAVNQSRVIGPTRRVGTFTPDPAYTAGVGQEPLGVYREAGRCYLTGAVYQADSVQFVAGAPYNLGTIPAEFAPANGYLSFPAHFKNTYATIAVYSNGQVQIVPGIATATYPAGEIVTHLSHISWVARGGPDA